MELAVTAAEFEEMTLGDLALLREAWIARETRLEDRAARQGLFIAAKVWDEKGTVKVEDLFPMLDPTAGMTKEEREKASWDQVKAIFAIAGKDEKGKPLYAIDRRSTS